MCILEFNRKRIHIKFFNFTNLVFLSLMYTVLLHLHNFQVKDRKAYQITSKEYKGQSGIDLHNRANSDPQ